MMYYFLNDDHTYRPCTLEEWSNQFEGMSKQGVRHVASDMVLGFHISTVWLGMDHAWFGGRPILFETMIFDGEKSCSDIYQNRYSTWDEAVAGHQHAIELIKGGYRSYDDDVE